MSQRNGFIVTNLFQQSAVSGVAPVVAPDRREGEGTAPDWIIEAREVTKRFGDVVAVDGAHLSVPRGNTVTFLGPSGCGKTTFLRLLAGLERCTEGEIRFNGRIYDSVASRIFVPPHKRRVGMVFQSYTLWPHLNVFENVAYPLRVRRAKKQDLTERVKTVLELVGLMGFDQRHVTTLSGGQQQRVAIARALIYDPDVLLLDEPFSSLDAALREQLRVEIRRLQQALNLTVVLVTHDQAEALAVSDIVAVMRDGRIIEVGTPNQLYRRPSTVVSRDSIGKWLICKATVSEIEADVATVELEGDQKVVLTCSTVADHPLARGDSCDVAIRPHDVEVVTRDQRNPARSADCLQGTITTRLFAGDRFEAEIAIPAIGTGWFYLPANVDWQEGQSVTLRFPRRRAIAWPR